MAPPKPKKGTIEEKIDWLIRNQALWADLARYQDVANSVWWEARAKPLVDEMKQAGLISKGTNWRSVNIDRLINVAIRDQHRYR